MAIEDSGTGRGGGICLSTTEQTMVGTNKIITGHKLALAFSPMLKLI
jgi:hypothetical protein